RGRLQNFVGTTHLVVHELELLDPRRVLSGHARPGAAINLRLHDPLSQRVRGNPQLPSYPRDGAVALTAAGHCLQKHPDRSLTKLGRVATTMSTVRCCHGFFHTP